MVQILFIENEGMAWGTEIQEPILTLFRLVAVGGIIGCGIQSKEETVQII
jgi:lipoprotein signal peptidase